jgi:8-oxo-dGTP pyrophosphatase MutT (NUDIX family)
MLVKDFSEFVERLEQRLTQALPGAKAHEVMRATPVGKVLPKFEHKLPPRPGSVLILLYPDQDKIIFPLIQRPEYAGAHSGQVSLPGGKAELGEDIITTALREGEEEIGISARDVKVIGTLSDFFVIPSNFLVTPVIGYVESVPVLAPDAIEVERILFGNVQALIHGDAIKSKEILAAGRFSMQAPHFDIDGQVVWGATAMMLNEFRTVALEIIPA